MQKAQEAAAVAEAQGGGVLRFKLERRIVHLEFFQRILDILVFLAFCRVHAAVHHGLSFLVSLQRFVRRLIGVGDGIAHPRVCHPLDAGAHVSYFTGLQLFGRNHARNAVAYFRYLVALAGIHELNEISFFYRAVENTGVDDHALVAVVIGVEDEALQAAVWVSLWRRNYLNQFLQHVVDAHAGLCRDQRRILRVDSDDIFDFFLGFIRAGAVQIHFVQHRQNLQVLIQGKVDISQSLCFHALGGIHHQHGAVAGS